MKSTEELLKLLENLDLEEFKKEDSFKDVNISEYLNTLLESHGLQAKDVILFILAIVSMPLYCTASSTSYPRKNVMNY